MKRYKFIFLLSFYLLLTVVIYAAFYIAPRESNTTQEVDTPEVISYPVSFVEEPEIPRTDARLLIFGDTALLEPLGKMVQEDPDYNPLENVKEKFSEYDYVVGNHEATIDGESVGAPVAGKSYTFTTPKESVKIYKDAGVDAFSYANNHTKDYGPKSVTHTIKLLREGGIDVFGAGNNSAEAFTPLIKEINGNKIAFLGYNCAEYAFNIAGANEPGTAYFNEYLVRDSIQKAKSNSDYVIVLSHCGDEHSKEPNQLQVQWAGIYTNAGADFVVGGHTHVRQYDTTINGKPVVHSVGNFMFPGQSWNPEAQIGWALEIIIENKQLKSYRLLDVKMDDFGVLSFME